MATFSAGISGVKEVMRVGTVIPGKGTIDWIIDVPRTNRHLEAVEFVGLKGTDGIVRDAIVAGTSSTSLRVVSVAGKTLTDKGYTLSSNYASGINDQGQVGINGYTGVWGAYIGNPDGSVVEIVRTGQTAPGLPNTFTSVTGSIRSFGQMLISGEINNGNVLNDSVIYRRSITGNLVKIAASLESAPQTSKTFGWLQASDMNETGEAVFYCYLNNASGNHDGFGIFKGRDTSGLKPVAYSGQSAPGGLGAFTAFDNSIGINEVGEVSFVGYYQGGSALFIGDGNSQRKLLKTGDIAPGGATFTGFSMSRISNSGTVFFAAQLNGGTTYQGIFMTDGRDVVKVAQAGDQVGGRTLTEIGVDPKAYNSFQQVAYQTKFSGDSGHSILLFAPRIRWRDVFGGGWDDAARWTASLTPAEYNHVDIIPDDGVPILGPLQPVAIGSLRIGAAVSGMTDFKLTTGTVTAADGVHVASRGKLSGIGTIIGDVTNASVVAPGNSPGEILIEGNYRQEGSGTLTIEIAGKEEEQFDRLLVDGDVSLAGGLEIDLPGGAIDRISSGDSFRFIGATGRVSGSFSGGGGGRVSSRNGFASFRIDYSGNQAVLSDFQPKDTDGDGVPDYWMDEHFAASGGNPGHADEDSDGDGVSNRDEYVAGTSPTDRASAFRATVGMPAGGLAKDTEGISVSFPTSEGRTYAVQHSPDLAVGNWEVVKSGIVGDGSVKTETIPPEVSQPGSGFYRVVATR
ncbi:MAG TPA: choice-of-anchor tandem repeat NxxGxxAF-containing protein [Luteolibacter sp.]|nr:choice-of-anchor tandem repeat NxxGxxAF-containing protein [Luteolibacter sp.]